MVNLDVSRGHCAGALRRERQLCGVLAVQRQGDTFQVQQDFDDVFLHALNGRVLVLDTVDLDFGDGATGHRRQQNATQRIAQRVTKASLEGLKGNRCTGIRSLINFDDAGCQKLSNRILHKTPSMISGIA